MPLFFTQPTAPVVVLAITDCVATAAVLSIVTEKPGVVAVLLALSILDTV